MMIQFSSEEELREFIDIMNRKAWECMIDCIMDSVKRVETPEGDVEPVELSCDGFNKCFGGKEDGNKSERSKDNL
jgi:hypothetical protein